MNSGNLIISNIYYNDNKCIFMVTLSGVKLQNYIVNESIETSKFIFCYFIFFLV